MLETSINGRQSRMIIELCSRELGQRKKRVQLHYVDHVLYVISSIVQRKESLTEDPQFLESLEEIGFPLKGEYPEILLRLINEVLDSLDHSIRPSEQKILELYKSFSTKFKGDHFLFDQNFSNIMRAFEKIEPIKLESYKRS